MRKLPKGEASFRAVYNQYVRRAKKKEQEFTLTKQEFRELCERPCYYCGARPNNLSRDHLRHNGTWEYNGLDRIDNSKGYLQGNVQPCCTPCNSLKSNLEEKEFLARISLIASRLWLGHLTEERLQPSNLDLGSDASST